MTDVIEIEIDGKKLSAKPNQMVIQVADEAGIYIPRFCYHKQLSIVANCRMCLVDVEKAPKPMPACALPVAPGMKVSTTSQKTREAQRAVMEYLLINHPLDCPICDQGGECELQDLSLAYGRAKSHFCEGKRSVADKNIGPLVATEMTRCIQCTRCVRFGDEIAGLRELGAVNRGEEMEITTYVEHALQSELSGNIIDICPVGALTAKPSRFRARAWELTQAPSISPHDCIGSNLNVHHLRGKVMRVVARENPSVNEMWIADRDRFSYEGLYHADRLTHPLVKLDGQWEKTDWLPALDFAVGGLRRVMATSSSEQLGALASPNATVEEFYLLQKLMRGLGCSNLDHRLRQTDFRDQSEMPLMPGLNVHIAELEQADNILLLGSNIQKEQPLAALRLRKAYLKGAGIFSINMMDYRFHFRQKASLIVAPDEMVQALAGVAQCCQSSSTVTVDPQLQQLLAAVPVNDKHQQIADSLKQGKKVFVLLGSLALNHPEASVLRRLARWIAEATGAQLGFLTEGANAAGAWLTGFVPHRRVGGKVNAQIGLHAQAMLEKKRKAYLLMHLEPDVDCANPVLACSALQQAEFVVAFSAFKSQALLDTANIIFPVAPFTENMGTVINAAGEWQYFKPVVPLYENTQPAWKVLSSMGNLFQLPGFQYETLSAVTEEMQAMIQDMTFSLPQTAWKDVVLPLAEKECMTRVGEVPIYAVDSLVRRSQPLQAAQQIVEGELAAVRLHPESGFKEGDIVTVQQQHGAVKLPVILDKRVPRRAAWIASGIAGTKELGEMFGKVEIKK